MAPVIIEMNAGGVPFTLINTGQHTKSSREIAQILGITAGDTFVTERRSDIVKASQAFVWFCRALLILLLGKKKFFAKGKGVCVIHGDTLSTLLGLVSSRLSGMKVAHIESGLRSHSLLHPFPEEIIRIISCRFSHYLFAPSETDVDNLKNSGAVIYNTRGNTVFDAIRYVQKLGRIKPLDFPYCVTTLHRSEVLFREDLLRIALSAVYEASQFIKVVFVIHRATEERLRQLGELNTIKRNENIIVKDYYDYPSFMALVQAAEFVMTDGGGLQEETFFLNVPCLILRKRTERKFGLGTTALLSEFKKEKIEYFLDHYRDFRREEYDCQQPSRFIVTKLAEIR